jgi:hypothetical protein
MAVTDFNPLVKFDPLIVTLCPPAAGPRFGETDVTEGAASV